MPLPTLRSALGPALTILALLLPLGARAAQRPVVLELFTSQSCSSCPPAEALLGDYAAAGADVLPLAFHVTYWNHLSWRDAFSLRAATERQAAHGGRLGESSFTPQLVVDGRRSVVGSQREAVAEAVARARDEARTVAPVSLARDGDRLVVAIGPGAGAGRITLVGFDRAHTTAVARGENAGRTLVQANVVRSVTQIGRWGGAAQRLSVPAPAGTDAAILVEGEDGRILGAARLGAPS